MKIPIFEEITLVEWNVEKLRKAVQESRIGKVPCYLNFTNLKKEEVDHLVLNLEQIILELNLHPLFPYPLYIISTIKIQSVFPSAHTVKDLPEHFFKKIKRPNNKELQLLNKIFLKVDKIKNLEIYNLIDDFHGSSPSQKNLYNETKELYFYESLNSILFNKPKK